MLNFSAVTAKAPANSMGSSGPKVANTSCSELWKDDVTYILTSVTLGEADPFPKSLEPPMFQQQEE